MEELNFTLQIITVDFFIAFGLYSFAYILVRAFWRKSILEKIDSEATKLISLMGLVYLILWLVGLILILNSDSEQDVYDFKNRVLGRYWFGYWIQPILWISLTQLLRFSRVRRNILSRLLIALVLIVSIERFVIISTALHRDYLPSSWTMYQQLPIYPSDIFLGIVVKVILYLAFTGLYFVIRMAFRRMNDGSKIGNGTSPDSSDQPAAGKRPNF